MSSSYRMELDRWLSSLDVSANRVLDCGGAQLSVKGRTKSWDVKEYLISDLPSPHKDSPKPDIEFDLNRPFIINAKGYTELSDDTSSFGIDIFEKFDLVFCLEVFDYVWATETAFDNIAKVLKKGGTAWITFPSAYPLHQPIEDDALRYMPGGIKKLTAYAGLSIEKMIPRRPETNLWQQFYTAERMRAAKHQDHAFTGWICKLSKTEK